jgi:hypothetical protein
VETESGKSSGSAQSNRWEDIPSSVRNDPMNKTILARAYKGDKAKFAKYYFAGQNND